MDDDFIKQFAWSKAKDGNGLTPCEINSTDAVRWDLRVPGVSGTAVTLEFDNLSTFYLTRSALVGAHKRGQQHRADLIKQALNP